MPSPLPEHRRRGAHVASFLGWTLVWLVGTGAVAGYSVTRHAPALERLMASDVQEEIAPLTDVPITVSVRDHAATLSGTVGDAARRDALLVAAAGGLGVRRVVDDLVVAPAEDGATEATASSTLSSGIAPEPDDAVETEEAVPGGRSADAAVPESDPETIEAAPSELASAEVSSGDAPETDGTVDEALASAEIPPGKPSPEPEDGAGAADAEGELVAAGLPSAEPTPGNELTLEEPSSEDAVATDRTGGEAPTLHLNVADRVMTLEGSMAASDDTAGLVAAAMDSFDLDFVSNTLEGDPDIAAADWIEPLAALLPALAALDDPDVKIVGRQVTLRGTAPDRNARGAVVAAALDGFGDHSLVELIDVEEDRASPPEGPTAVDPDTVPVPAPRTAPLETALLRAGDDGLEPVASRSEPRRPSSVAALRSALAALPGREILFESGSARPTAESLDTLDDIASVLLAHPGIPLAIEGHTDGRGYREENLNLSQRRANAVRDGLVSRGVSYERLTSYGYGESVPIADNKTPEGRAANRRIEFTF